MKLSKILLIITFNFISIYSFAQEEIKKWSKTDSLTWADFKSEPDLNSPYSAWSHYGIKYSYKYTSNQDGFKFSFNVYSFLDKEKSWSKINKQSAELLKHEQLHFDIAELYARKLLEKLNSMSNTKNNIQDEVRKAFSYYLDEMKSFQIVYDEETKHMLNRRKQKEWENNIKTELEKTENIVVAQQY